MKTIKKKSWVVPALFAGVPGLLVLFVVAWTARAGPLEQLETPVPAADAKVVPTENSAPPNLPAPAPVAEVAAPAEPVQATIALLDRRRQFALGMIETGNQDDEVGQAGEVSRYQIMPSVWKHYSGSSHYQNPEVSLAVARQHWTALCSAFKQQAHREPKDFDIYVLWNTRHGYYASKGFNPARLHPVVRDRAQRFVNLLTRADS